MKEHGEEPPLPGIDLSHDQLFFLNFAQVDGWMDGWILQDLEIYCCVRLYTNMSFQLLNFESTYAWVKHRYGIAMGTILITVSFRCGVEHTDQSKPLIPLK